MTLNREEKKGEQNKGKERNTKEIGKLNKVKD